VYFTYDFMTIICNRLHDTVLDSDGSLTLPVWFTGWLKKSKLLISAVNEINASQTRFFAKFIPKLVEKMFDMCSIVPNYSFSILKIFY